MNTAVIKVFPFPGQQIEQRTEPADLTGVRFVAVPGNFPESALTAVVIGRHESYATDSAGHRYAMLGMGQTWREALDDATDEPAATAPEQPATTTTNGATPKPRKYNPAWRDTTRAARQAQRQQTLNAAAQAAGFDTWRKLETAVKNGAGIQIAPVAEPMEPAGE